ncbi:LamG-like jellyroll fold domain-containing protein, partial [Planctomycetota bacterium]
EANDTVIVDVKPWYFTGLTTHYEFEDNLLDTALASGSGGSSAVADDLINAGGYPEKYGPSGAPSLGRAIYLGKNGEKEEYSWLETPDSVDLDMENLGDIDGVTFGAPFTIECYLRPDIPEVSKMWSYVISKWNDNTVDPTYQRSYNCFLYNGRVALELADITDTDPPPSTDDYYGYDMTLAGEQMPRSDEWQHVAWVGNADGSFDIWIDGVLRATAQIYDGRIANTTAPLRIGDAGYDPADGYRGWIDDVKIWRINLQEEYMKERAQALAVQGPVPKYKHQYVAGDAVLNWAAAKGYDNPTYSVYMGTDPGNMELAAAHITENFYDPCGPGNDPDLLADTTYYWKVNIDGGTEGNLWSFKTVLNTYGFLAGHWKFDEPTGTVFHDSAGCDDVGYYRYPEVGDKDPPLRPKGAWIYPPGQGLNRALQFRTYEYVDIEACDPNVYSYMPHDSYSITFWMRTMPEFRNVWAYFIAKGGNSYRIGRFYDTNFIRFYCSGAINYGPASYLASIVVEVPVGDGYWHHVAGVYEAPTRFSAGGIYLYIDGELEVSGPVAGNHNINTDSNVQIGGNAAWPTREFTGALDDVRIYHHHALSAEEIYDLANPPQIINSPPTVKLGNNVIVPYPDPPGPYTTTLTPTVNDDSYPLLMSPRIAWTKLSGPGEVIIDPCIIEWGDWGDFIPSMDCPLPTNITFSAPGYYQLRLKADDIWYTNEDTLWVWVQGAAGMDRTVGYWRFEEDVLETDYPKSADGDNPNTLVIANEVPGGLPLIGERDDPCEAPGLHNTVAVSPIPLTGAVNNKRLGAGIGRLDFVGERVGTSGYDIEMIADSWGGLVFCEEAITVECWFNLNEQEGTIFDLEDGNQGLRIFNTSTGVFNNWSGISEWDNVSVPANTLMVEFWVETEIPNEYQYNCLITDIDVYEAGWKHIAFTYDKESGVARVFENGEPAWLTHWFDSTRKSPTGTEPKGFKKFLPIVQYYDGQDGRVLALAENLDLLVAAGVDEEAGGLDELRITAETLYPPKFLIMGPKMCETKIEGDMDGDCDVDLVDMKLFWDGWLTCNNADPNACFKK